MLRQILVWLLWIGLVSYAVLLAPPDRPDTFLLIQKLSTAQIEGINPAIVALFNLMGIWPLVYCGILFTDGRSQRVPAWVFAIASFAVGAFALIPYLALRQPNLPFTGQKNWVLKLWDSRGLGVLLTIGAIGLLIYGITQGNWPDFGQQWQTNRFIHVMSLDFCMLSVLFPALLRDDLGRRGLKDPRIFWAVSLIPLIGPLLYLCFRPSLPESILEIKLD
jgi:hypothetical protein